VIAPLVNAKKPGQTIRVWVPGCATGEEAYSIAMLILERFEREKKRCLLRVFATDIQEEEEEEEEDTILGVARRGRYPGTIAADISPERLARFFTHTYEGLLVVKPELRSCVTFAVQNLISDAPFSKVDLVSCRNVLGPLDRDTQNKILGVFHFSLSEKGAL